MVNHIWMRHFGKPLVDNVFDFGLRSPKPLHHELLDWLAVELVESGWRMKPLHRKIVTSQAFALASSGDASRESHNRRLDPDNETYWRFDPIRLEAEAIRDSLLAVGGELDRSLGGPDIDHNQGEQVLRRSLYFRHAYEKQMTMLTTFDAASPNICYRRDTSIVPQQALVLANSELARRMSEALAGRLSRRIAESGGPDEANDDGFIRNEIYPLQVGYQKHGESGLEISDWWPHLAQRADDLCLIRSMWTEDSNHGAQLQFHTGRHRVDGFFPTIGSWVNYGLGSINENLPQFVVMGTPIADCCGGMEAHRANYLGPRYDGVPMSVDPQDPMPYAKPPERIDSERQQAEFELLRSLNQMTADAYPSDEAVRARMEAYKLAFRMQTAVPDVVELESETAQTHQLYGLDQKETAPFGRQMLTARRLVERGVRFVQVYHGSNGGAGSWDSHKGLKTNHSRLSRQVDQPIAALLTDLRRRGLLEETLVVWATEFGRTPGSQHSDGRDHHPYGFTVWMAGGGIRGGVAHGATDEIGFHAVEDRHYVTDVHATVLHQLGLDPRKLSLPQRKRIEKDYGKPIADIIS